MMRRIATFLVMLAGLSSCGPLPRPFQHDGDEQKLAAPKPLQPIAVKEIQGMPGLAAAMVASFEQEDIAASLTAGGDRFLVLQGRVESDAGKRQLHWQITDAGGAVVSELDQTLGPAAAADSLSVLAPSAAASIAKALRGDDLGGSDLAARPKVAVDEIKVTGMLEADPLKRALITALAQHGINVVRESPSYRVSGFLRITPGLAGHDLVEVTWVVADAAGVELGKVNQGSPTLRDDLVSHAAQITHQIADGGAEGIEQLVRMKR